MFGLSTRHLLRTGRGKARVLTGGSTSWPQRFQSTAAADTSDSDTTVTTTTTTASPHGHLSPENAEMITFPSATGEGTPVLLNAQEHAVGYLSKILNARVYDAARETELLHAKNLSAVRFLFFLLYGWYSPNGTRLVDVLSL